MLFDCNLIEFVNLAETYIKARDVGSELRLVRYKYSDGSYGLKLPKDMYGHEMIVDMSTPDSMDVEILEDLFDDYLSGNWKIT